ncbi:MAG: hypothetical protein MUF49_16125 [Oculatellaceae cyanobacterium Prado106]|jgi:hypothetical protein|nr:hypothetical protein [Oculatellaceae cyanobacterium Prado106]
MDATFFYHGWLIELSGQQPGYSFHCWMPGRAVGVSDRQIYIDFQAALAAAQQRADLEAARLAIAHCQLRYLQGEILDGDYRAIVEIITDLVQE